MRERCIIELAGLPFLSCTAISLITELVAGDALHSLSTLAPNPIDQQPRRKENFLQMRAWGSGPFDRQGRPHSNSIPRPR
jgi:hypothetical protein